MTKRMRTGIGTLLIAVGLAGCRGFDTLSAPLAPLPVPERPPIQLVVFTDPTSGFSTSDVRDAQEQIVRFNTAAELIWTADGTHYPGYSVRGNFVPPDGSFLVLFGTKDGERRAYLTFSMDYHHYGPPAIVVDVEVVDGQLAFRDTTVTVPGT